MAFKVPCRVATTAAITLSGLQTIDGVALAAGDRVLVKDQASSADNDIYVAATGAWVRAKDFDGSRDVVNGTKILIARSSPTAPRFGPDQPTLYMSNHRSVRETQSRKRSGWMRHAGASLTGRKKLGLDILHNILKE